MELDTTKLRAVAAWRGSAPGDNAPTAGDRNSLVLRARRTRFADSDDWRIALLREGDHRIKNSLQIVASLLEGQALQESFQTARDALRNASARIQAIAHIHDALQAGAGEDLVDLDMLIADTCRSLQLVAGDPEQVRIVVDTVSVRAPTRIAQPILLAVTELVINALRHAFPDGRRGVVTVSLLKRHNRLHIVVADDGIGLPVDGMQGRGFGMKLLRMAAAQISAEILVERDAGSRFTIVAPAPEVETTALTPAGEAP